MGVCVQQQRGVDLCLKAGCQNKPKLLLQTAWTDICLEVKLKLTNLVGVRASREVRNQIEHKNKNLFPQIHKLNYLEETAEA